MHVCNSARCAGDAAAWTAQRLVLAEVTEAEAEAKGEAQEKVEQTEDARGVEQKSSAPAHGRVSALPRADCDSESDGESDSVSNSKSDGESDRECDSDSGEDIAQMRELLRLRQVKIDERVSGRPLATGQPASAKVLAPIFSTSEPSSFSGVVAVDTRSLPSLPIVPIEVDYDVSTAQHGADDADVERLLSRYRAEAATYGSDGSVGAITFAAEADEPLTPEEEACDAFRDCLARAPGHVVRYQRGGAAVWPAHPAPAASTLPPCVCGAPRLFELQLMPACLHFLQVDNAVPPEQEEAGMNWACAALFTCADDCETVMYPRCGGSSHSLASEAVRVQPDEF